MNLQNVNYSLLPKGFIVYQLLNIINNKSYIGLSKNLKERIQQHKKCSSGNSKINCYIHEAIKKYGFENFEIIILKECNKLDLAKNEEDFIKSFKSNNSNFGYNLTSGGENPIDNLETINKRQKANKNMVKVASYDLNGNLLETFISIKECERFYNISDSDIHRCIKKDWTRLNLRFRKFTNTPLNNIEIYTDKKSMKISLRQKGRIASNKIKCKAVNKITKEIFEADSILKLSLLTTLHITTIHKIIKNLKHKKWLILKEVS